MNFSLIPPLATSTDSRWLVRVSTVFENELSQIFESMGARVRGRWAKEYYHVELGPPAVLEDLTLPPFIRWRMPLHHLWPCRPETMPGFVEKAASALFWKLGDREVGAIRMGALDPALEGGYYRRLASNLRGRTLQLFPPFEGPKDPEDRPPEEPTLFCLVGREGLFCGISSSRRCGGFHPGGTRYTSQSHPETISRAGGKLVEALHHLRLYRPRMEDGAHWLELGASPGGMTSELLRRKQRVTAVDRAPLDERLNGREGLMTHTIDVANYSPRPNLRFDALLCDMNGAALDSLQQVIRLSRYLKQGAPVIFTLKAGLAVDFSSLTQLYREAVAMAAKGGLKLISRAHLTYNRLEFTLFFSVEPLVPGERTE